MQCSNVNIRSFIYVMIIQYRMSSVNRTHIDSPIKEQAQYSIGLKFLTAQISKALRQSDTEVYQIPRLGKSIKILLKRPDTSGLSNFLIQLLIQQKYRPAPRYHQNPRSAQCLNFQNDLPRELLRDSADQVQNCIAFQAIQINSALRVPLSI